jgi:hypothetical protein
MKGEQAAMLIGLGQPAQVIDLMRYSKVGVRNP